jgi:hypothetical protein
MLANHVAVVAYHHSSVPDSLPMSIIPLEDGADDDHAVLASKALQQLRGGAGLC